MNHRFAFVPQTVPAVLMILAMAGCSAPSSSSRTEAPRWVSLIQNGSLDGWVQRGGNAGYRVEGDTIIGTTAPNTPNSFLCTVRHYTNFIFEIEFKTVPGGNSGVQIRSHARDEPTQLEWNGRTIRIPAGRVHGYQIEIDPSARAWSGGLYDEGRRGWLQNLTNNPAARAAFRTNDWNHFRIHAEGDWIRSWLNGVPAADYRDALTPSGFIGLQVHGVGNRTEPLEIRFRHPRVRELP